ncbi:MAG: NAD(P)-dependent oxidoreductase [Actinomycetota bacterium]
MTDVKVGFIGLGVMGRPIAKHLMANDHHVTVASRSRGPIDDVLLLGAVDGGSPAGVVAASDVTILCVPNSPDVAGIIDGVLDVVAGKVIIDCSTIDPDVEREQHDRVSAAGGDYLEAPLSGGSTGAENGTLTLMVGGDAAVLDHVRAVLESFSRMIVHVGGPGLGQAVKLANNLIYAAQMQATAEAFTLVDRAGADLGKTLEVLKASSGDCVAVRTRVPFEGVQPDSPASNGWRPGFATDLMAKDIDLAIAYAARLGVPVESAVLARQLLTAAQDAGYGAEDFSAVGKVVRARVARP